MAEVNEGDWVTGAVQWWWKYVLPAEDRFWISILAQRADPTPDPWQQVSAEILQAVAILHATGKTTDPAIRQRLQHEAASKLKNAAEKVGAGHAG